MLLELVLAPDAKLLLADGARDRRGQVRLHVELQVANLFRLRGE
jgi:hypothetical protein